MFKNKIPEEAELFCNEKDIANRKDLCCYIGDFFEEASSQILKVDRLRNARYMDINPDLANKERSLFYESKASNQSSRGAAIKVEQFNCYKNFVDFYLPSVYAVNPIFKVNVFYIFWFYNLPSMGYVNQRKLRQDLAACDKELFMLSIDSIYTIAKFKPEQQCFRITQKHIEDFMDKIDDPYIIKAMTNPISVYDQPFPDIMMTTIL